MWQCYVTLAIVDSDSRDFVDLHAAASLNQESTVKIAGKNAPRQDFGSAVGSR